MKILTLAVGTACLVGLCAGPAFAQVGAGRAVYQPTSIQPTEYKYGSYVYANADGPVAADTQAPPAPPAQTLPADKAYDPSTKKDETKTEAAPAEEKKDDSGDEAKEEEKKPWTLPQPRFFKNHNIRFGGWVDQGVNVNFNGTDFNGPVVLDDRSGYQLNQLWFFLDRPTNTSEQDWDWGFHVDAVFGTDWRLLKPVSGMEEDWNETSYYQFVLPQFYFDLAYEDWTFRFGRFFTLIGYEVIPATQNFFYSQAYTHIYGEPTTHLGGYAIRKFGEKKEWAVTAGITEGCDIIFGGGSPNFTGAISYTEKDGKYSLAYSIHTGQWAPAGVNQTIYSLIGTKKLGEKWKYVIEHDMGQQTVSAGTPALPGQWFGLAQYLFYEFDKKWSAGMRVEWFRDDDGIRVTGLYPPNPIAGSSFAGNFYEITWGVNWKPNLNTTIRPEIRYDWYQGPASPVSAPLPYGNGTKVDQGMVACDVVFTF